MLVNYMKHTNNQKYLFKNKNKKFNDRFIRDILASINFSQKLSPHTIRRSQATHLLNKGVNMLYIKELLGHESITTTGEYVRGYQSTKFEAIKNASPKEMNENLEDWNNDQDLLKQLLNL